MRFLRILAVAAMATPAMFAQYIAYFGTYTQPNKSKGIYAYRYDGSSGKLTSLGLAAETSNPSFLALHPNGRFLYAVNENKDGGISAFAIDKASGMLKELNHVSARGAGPCHLMVDKTGKWLYAANYDGGSIVAYAVKSDGSLGESSAFDQHTGKVADPIRQEGGPHAHGTYVSPDNHFLLVPDLGLDEVMVYHLDAAKGALPKNDPPFLKTPPRSGPRHLAFAPNGHFVYVLTEIAMTVMACRYDAQRGTLEEMQTVDASPGQHNPRYSGAEIEVHPSGKFVYASLRGPESIAAFAIDAAGKLTPAGHFSTGGKEPRAFAIDPTGHFLLAANQNSASVVVFRIDEKTGALTPTGETVNIPSPVTIVFAK
jgi:6-phosphogluconolactonase